MFDEAGGSAFEQSFYSEDIMKKCYSLAQVTFSTELIAVPCLGYGCFF